MLTRVDSVSVQVLFCNINLGRIKISAINHSRLVPMVPTIVSTNSLSTVFANTVDSFPLSFGKFYGQDSSGNCKQANADDC